VNRPETEEYREWKREFDRENPHVECGCSRNDPPEAWCPAHANMWMDEEVER